MNFTELPALPNDIYTKIYEGLHTIEQSGAIVDKHHPTGQLSVIGDIDANTESFLRNNRDQISKALKVFCYRLSLFVNLAIEHSCQSSDAWHHVFIYGDDVYYQFTPVVAVRFRQAINKKYNLFGVPEHVVKKYNAVMVSAPDYWSPYAIWKGHNADRLGLQLPKVKTIPF